jgi:hypothetical protein
MDEFWAKQPASGWENLFLPKFLAHVALTRAKFPARPLPAPAKSEAKFGPYRPNFKGFKKKKDLSKKR